MKKQTAPLITVVLIALLAPGCAKDAGPEKQVPRKKPVPLVYVEAARQETIADELDLTGTVEPARIARLASAAEGPVESLEVREGDGVTNGAVLVTIGRSEAAIAALAAAKEDLAKEQEEFRRVTKLVKSGAMAGDALDTAQSRLEQARAKVALAEERNRDYRVLAPWAGLVSRVFVREGFYVAPRTPLIEMFDPQSLVVRFHVPEEASMRVRIGMKIRMTLDAHPGRSFEGHVNRIYPELDARTRTRTVEAELTGEAELLKGMFVRLLLPLQTVEDAITVPDAALIATPDGKTVVYVVADDTASRRVVGTGIETDGRVQIVNGVEPGDKVVVRGNEKLKDGAQVRLPKDGKGGKPPVNPHAGDAS